MLSPFVKMLILIQSGADWGGSSNTSLLSHNPGGKKSESKVLARLVSSKAFFLGLSIISSLSMYSYGLSSECLCLNVLFVFLIRSYRIRVHLYDFVSL